MKPLKRIEHFLAKIAGDDSEKELSPKTRYEHYLNEIAENISSGGSRGGDGVDGPLVIHESIDESYTGEGTKFVLDVTTEELLAAVNAGRVIVNQTITEVD